MKCILAPEGRVPFSHTKNAQNLVKTHTLLVILLPCRQFHCKLTAPSTFLRRKPSENMF